MSAGQRYRVVCEQGTFTGPKGNTHWNIIKITMPILCHCESRRFVRPLVHLLVSLLVHRSIGRSVGRSILFSMDKAVMSSYSL